MFDLAAFEVAARQAVLRAMIKGLEPDPEMTVSQWADARRRLSVESSPLPGQWRTTTTPYLREIMDCLSPSHPAWKVTAKKGAQLGFTDAGINWLGMIADIAPGPCGVFQPTIDACSNFTKTKLDPAVEVTPALKGKVAEQKSRDGQGSTTRFKRFPGGFWVLSGANSSAGLQMFSFRYLFKDELSEWPEDAGGRGDPSDQADARTDAFEAIRKIYQASTPGLRGMCRISAEYEASDQRRYYLACPFCRFHQVLLWGNLVENAPGLVGYRCAGCAEIIPEHQKPSLLRAAADGGTALWIKCHADDDGEVPADLLPPDELARWADRGSDGRQPGFWINQLYSPFKSWASLLDQWRKSEGDVQKEKVFRQQVLGLEWEETGEAPETDLLMLRREDYPLQKVPAGGLVLTMGIDVQKDYLQYELVAWGRGRESWSVDFGVIEGDTASPPVWDALDRLLARAWPDWQGVAWPVEMTAIDAGYNTQWVYQFTRTRPRAMAVKGMPGHLAPAVGLPTPQEVSWRGKRIKRGAMLWPIGDWTLKAEIYANLRKSGPQDGAECFPPGYCHFSLAHDKSFFEQLTAERLITRLVRGREAKEWVLRPGVKNEALDCRKMAMAAAVHLGLWRLDDDGWQHLAAARGAPPAPPQGELALFRTLPEPDKPVPAAAAASDSVEPPPRPSSPSSAGRGVRSAGIGV